MGTSEYPPADAWIVSSIPDGDSSSISKLRVALRRLPFFAGMELARYMVPSGPLDWSDLAKHKMHLDDYKQPEEWPKLSAKLREIVKSCHKDGEMPKDVSLDMWAKLAGDYHRTRPSWSPTDSAISTPTVSDTPEPSTLPCHQTIVHRAHLVVLSPRSKSSKEKFSGRIVLDPPTTDMSCRYYAMNSFPGVAHFHGTERFIRVNITVEDQWKMRNDSTRKIFENLAASRIWIGYYAYRPLSELFFFFTALNCFSTSNSITKDNNLFLYCEQGSDISTVSLHDFVDHMIPFELNSHMTQDKWIARFQLGLSKTVPTTTFGGYHIRRVPNIYSNSLLIGRHCMEKVVTRIFDMNATGQHPYVPSAIRGTLAGLELYWRLAQDVHENTLPDEETDYLELPKHVPQLSPSKGGLSSKIVFVIDHIDGTSLESNVPDLGEIRWSEKDCGTPGNDMTDGHGLMSDEAAADIKEWLGHEDISLAYQARLLGSKGVWSPLPAEIASAPHNAGKWIEIRDSQLKYFTSIERDGVFEVVKTSDSRPAITMTHQLLQILGDNGVNSLIFKKLIEDNHKEVLAELAKFDILSEEGLRRFLQRVDPQAVEKAERPVDMNLDPGSAVKKRTFSAMETEDSDLRKNSGQFLNQYSHCPSQAVHRAMGMLDAGFDPKKNIYFASLLLDIMKSSDGKCSVPDPTGTLKPGEIYFQSSTAFSQATLSGRKSNILERPCLVTRDPALLPTDVRKVRAVRNDNLRDFLDVIVFPSQGSEALCSLLGGGDYDGDTVKLIWDPQIVIPFSNASLEFAFPPDDLEHRYITSRSGRMDEVTDRFTHKRTEVDCRVISRMLSSTLFIPKQFGILANMHTTASYEKGHRHPDTTLLAYLFAISLDGGKSGKFIKEAEMKGLQKKFGNRFPGWARGVPMDPIQRMLAQEVKTDCQRAPGDPDHIMDILTQATRTLGALQQENAVKILSEGRDFAPDEHLKSYCKGLETELENVDNNKMKRYKEDLVRIKRHVIECMEKLRDINAKAKSNGSSGQRFDYQAELAALTKEMHQPLDLESDRFNNFDAHDVCRKYKASYAYEWAQMGSRLSLTSTSHRLKGPFVFFFRELTNFKASATIVEADRLRGGDSMLGTIAQSMTDEACQAAKRRRRL